MDRPRFVSLPSSPASCCSSINSPHPHDDIDGDDDFATSTPLQLNVWLPENKRAGEAKVHSSRKRCLPTSCLCKKKRVSFPEDHTPDVIPIGDHCQQEEANHQYSSWLSREDIRKYQATVLEIRRMIQKTAPDEQDLLCIRGLEAIIPIIPSSSSRTPQAPTTNYAFHSKLMKHASIQAVIKMQEKQRRMHHCNPELISATYQHFGRTSVQQAFLLGMQDQRDSFEILGRLVDEISQL